MWLNHRMNLVDCISHITSCLVKPLWSPSYRNRFLSNRIMSKETLVSKVGSCNSLTAGTNACAQIAGLRLDGMDVGALRKTLQDSWGVMWNHALLCIYHIYIYIQVVYNYMFANHLNYICLYTCILSLLNSLYIEPTTIHVALRCPSVDAISNLLQFKGLQMLLCRMPSWLLQLLELLKVPLMWRSRQNLFRLCLCL